MKSNSISSFIEHHFRHFNAATLKDAAHGYQKHLADGGKMFLTLAGAMSTAELGLSLAEMIRQDKVHAICCTGANLEEDIFNLVAHDYYERVPNYRDLTPDDEQKLLERHMNRVTDTCIPEMEAMRRIESVVLEEWVAADKAGERYFPHEFMYKLLLSGELDQYFEIDPKDSWMMAAAKKNIPIVVPGWEDSTMGNIFASYTYDGKYRKDKKIILDQNIMKTGLEYFTCLYDWYMDTSKKHPIAFLQLGGGIAADFPICVVPSLKHDLQLKKVRDWAGFIEIGSSPMSYGSYSGAGGKEKITWDKLSTGSYYQIIQSDVTVVFPWIAAVLLGL